MRIKSLSRGDTVIEVLLAITVFSLIAVGGISLMNRGVAIAQQSLEVSLVRHQIDAQADALRYLAHAYAADYPDDSQATRIWNKAIGENGVPSAQPFSEIIDGTRCKLPSGATSKPFALNIRKLDSIGGDSSPQGPVVSVMNISDFDSGHL